MSQVSNNDSFDREAYKTQKREEKDRIADKADFSIRLTSAFLEPIGDSPMEPTGYELLTEEELEHELMKGEQLNV